MPKARATKAEKEETDGPMPKRIQMTRAKGGWRADNPDAVIVARPSEFGNRFPMQEATQAERQRVTELFARWLITSDVRMSQARYELRGRDLACWCPLDQPCHADVLLKVANADLETSYADIRLMIRRAYGF